MSKPDTAARLKGIAGIFKRLWLLLLFGGVGLYFAGNVETILSHMRQVSAVRLILALGFLAVSKLLLVRLSQHSVEVTGQEIGYARMFQINSMSQLAKYLPGGVWHFVGRAAYYHAEGLSLKQTSQAIVIENLWLVTSAAFAGGILFSLYAKVPTSAAVLVLLWALLLYIMTRWRVPQANWRDTLSVGALQSAVWILLGASFLILLPINDPALLPLAMGGFGLSWVAGYVSIFAPGGVGVREATLTALMSAALPPESVIVYAAINRVLWVIVESALGLIAKLISRPV